MSEKFIYNIKSYIINYLLGKSMIKNINTTIKT